MAHEDLESYYKVNFALVQHHKYSLTELENMIPWERELYISLLVDHIKDENLKGIYTSNNKIYHGDLSEEVIKIST